MAENKADSSEELQARKLLAEAEKKSSGKSGGFMSGIFGGGSSKIDDAIELYCKAANFFKMAKNWGEAGNCFSKAASLSLGADNKLEAFQKFSDASNCYKKVDPARSLECLKQAVAIQTEMGRFTMAAKTHISIAEIYETDLQDLEQAMVHYQKAADYYQGEESQSHAQKCLLKVAQFAADKEDYQKAIQIFEQVANRCAENPMLKYGAKEYYFKAALCHMCVDTLNAQHALARYLDVFPALQDSREFQLMKKVLDCMESTDVDSFTAALQDYDKISRLDPWATSIFLRAKRSMGDNDLT
ncbi:Alpha-soluble NSF attachment protein [Hypsibius exemplaris]|uniref:Alpha-soluble NSF attachment protein n=1 Tax=Hypsibius exemplaris TaxID=2072580 RepID=A0A1W0X993_HYPEX|nr:Alpha-soluble NSF attachment protein [Hypsibius exemplaris]